MQKLLPFSEKFFVAGTAFVVLLVMGYAGWMMWGPSLTITPAAAVSAPPAFDASSSANTGANTASTLTWSHAVSGADRLLLVGVSIRNSSSQTVSSVTYNGTALTKVKDAKNGSNARAELWRLVNPPSGTFPIVVTLSGSARFVAGATSFIGVDQTAPLGTAVSATGSNSSPSVTIASAANELAVDVVASKNSSFTLTTGSGQTQRYQNATTNSSSSNNVRGGGSTEPGVPSVVMSWTLSGSTTWAIVGVSIKPSPVPDTTPPLISNVNASSITSSSATITWTTDEPSDSQVEYGLTASYGSQTILDPALVTSHSQLLSSLTASTLYHYRVKSKDASGNLAVSGDFTFTTATPDTRPNIITVMLDDLDDAALKYAINLGWMPNLTQYLVQQGVDFKNFYDTFSLCCPGRATFLTGQYAHNHNVKGNHAPAGSCTALNDQATLPVWLRTAGYRTGIVGKYLNGFGMNGSAPLTSCSNPQYIGPGWDDWQVLIGPGIPQGGMMYNYKLSDNGQTITYGSTPADYQTDVVAGRSVDFIQESSPTGQPFFLLITPGATHVENLSTSKCSTNFGPYDDVRAAPRHEGTAEGIVMPKGPSFNEADITDKPQWVQDKVPSPLTSSEIACHDTMYQDALEALRSIDDMIGTLVQTLVAQGEWGNTVLMFTSDNGFQRGDHRLEAKRLAYEESLKLPLYVRYPQNQTPRAETALVVNTDFAPTIAALANVTPSLAMDGSSLAPILQGSVPQNWRKRFLIEHTQEPQTWILSYSGVRTGATDLAAPNLKYVESSDGSREFYDMTIDPYELTSLHNDPSRQSQITTLQGYLNNLKTCGNGTCQTLEAQ